jgi:hypothetical protein
VNSHNKPREGEEMSDGHRNVQSVWQVRKWNKAEEGRKEAANEEMQ